MSILHRGKLLRTETGLVVALLERASKNGWNCMVVKGIEHYPVGGYDVFVFDEDLKQADEISLDVEIKPCSMRSSPNCDNPGGKH